MSRRKVTWTCAQRNDLCADILINAPSRKTEFSALLISDAHWDHPDCDRRAYDRAINEAVKRGAPIFYNGDTLCLMQTLSDRRATKGKTRPEHDEQDYFRAIAIDFVESHRHAAKNIAWLGYGNHETAPLKHYSVDPIRMVADQCERLTGHRPAVGGYRGWLQFRVRRCNGVNTKTVRVYHHHGHGGGGPVTKGVIGTNRMNAYVDSADIIWTGHVHERWMVDTPIISLTRLGKEVIRDRWHLCTPGYKEEFAGAKLGYHVQNGRPPKPTGAAWLHLWLEREELRHELRWTR